MKQVVSTERLFVYGALCIAAIAVLVIFYTSSDTRADTQTAAVAPIEDSIKESAAISPEIAALSSSSESPSHLQTPTTVHGIYLTGWSAGIPRVIDRTIDMATKGAINSVVIDIKDATGKLSYAPLDPSIVPSGAVTHRIKDVQGLIRKLHEHNIYVIGRLVVFEDPYFALAHPEAAFTNTKTGQTWKNYKGIAWLRPDSTEVWEYVSAIAKDASLQGFDEINLDYVRFPSDGDLVAIDRPKTSELRISIMTDFFSFLDQSLRKESGIVLSADIFGLTLSAKDDLGIGQKLEAIAPYVDYLSPMIYPSHFAPKTYGIDDPSRHPYEMIHRSLQDGIQKLAVIGYGPDLLRPWLQDFDLLGVHYTKDEIAQQIRGGTEQGVDSWLFWDPRNSYDSFRSFFDNQ